MDVNAVENGKKQEIYPHEFTKFVSSIKRARSPEDIMRVSSFLSSLAMNLVFNPKKPEKLDEMYKRALAIHLILLVIPWVSLLLNPKFAILSLLASYLIHKLDFNYSKWRTDYEWFKV